jgi:two-component system response regulator PfeR
MNEQDIIAFKRILVIAEDGTTRSRIVTRFQSEGYTVLAAQDSMEALTLLDQHALHVIVLQAPVRASLGLDMLEPLRNRRHSLVVAAILLAADATLILDSASQDPRILSDQPMSLDQLMAQVDRLAAAASG